MEQQDNSLNTIENDGSKPQTVKAPMIVIVISWLMLLGGILQLPIALLSFFIDTFNGVLIFAIAIISIVTSFGLRKMKKWALYIFTVMTVLSIAQIAYWYILTGSITNSTILLVQIIILVYFWIIYKKFSN